MSELSKPSSTEQKLSRALRIILESAATEEDITQKLDDRDLLLHLEHFVMRCLAEMYSYWRKEESLDGILVSAAQKIGSEQADINGVCCLISDQVFVPFSVRLRVACSDDIVEWMECRIGRKGTGKGGIERGKYKNWHRDPFVHFPETRPQMEWAYKITFGQE